MLGLQLQINYTALAPGGTPPPFHQVPIGGQSLFRTRLVATLMTEFEDKEVCIRDLSCGGVGLDVDHPLTLGGIVILKWRKPRG